MDSNPSEHPLPAAFVDYPTEEHQEDYGPARAYLKERATELDWLLGLYEYGSVGAPGISDIDLIAVISSDIDPDEARLFLTGAEAPEHVVRVFDHGTIKPVSKALFKQIQILGEIHAHSIFEADPINSNAPDHSIAKYVDAANIFDWLPERILMLRSLLMRPTFPYRRVLGGLGSFGHSVSTVSRVLGYKPPESTVFSDTYNDLRSNWFSKSESENLEATVALIQSAITTGRHLISRATEKMLEDGLITDNNQQPESIFWLNSTKALVFGGANGDSSPTEETDGLLSEHLPLSWLPVYRTYAEASGAISTLISSNIDLQPGYSHPELHSEFREILKKRIEWINESFDFLDPLGMTEFMYRFSHLRTRS